MTHALLRALAGKLIVSCQPVTGGPMDRPDIVAATALAALAGGASALRLEGIANIRAVRQATDAPVIGLIKRDLPGTALRITPFAEDVRALAEAGADIIAVDATALPRPEPVPALIAAIRQTGRLAMADCATLADARSAQAAGAEILGSTMSGYTGGPVPDEPDLALVSDLAALGAFTIAEGRYQSTDQAAAAIRAGADAVVIGTAITRTEVVTGWFAEAVAEAVTGAVTGAGAA